MAVVSHSNDCDPPSRIFKGQNMTRSNMLWESKIAPDERNPYQNEWNDLMDAIRNDKPYNEVERGVKASVTSSLGRKAAHTGQEITFDEMLNSEPEYAPGADKFTMNSPAPVTAGPDGKYPQPMPGITRDREY